MVNETMISELLEKLDITKPAPTSEPERQYYFMKKAREYVKKQSEKLGRPLSACITTFGCQMVLVHNIPFSLKNLYSSKEKSGVPALFS